MLMNKNAYLLIAVVSALPLQVHAGSTSDTFTLSGLRVTTIIEGAGELTQTFSQASAQTPEPSRPATVTETKHQTTSVLTLAPTETKTGTLTTTTKFDRITTPYIPGYTPTTTFQSLVTTPSITAAVQRVRLFGTIVSNLDVVQTLRFSLTANGRYVSYSDDGSKAVPGAPTLLYNFSDSDPTTFDGSSAPNISYNSSDSSSDSSAYKEITTGGLTLILQPHAIKYFATKISTAGHSSISDYAIAFTGATVNGMAGESSSQPMASSYDTTIAMTVPEPGAYTMILAGLGVMGFVGRRHKKLAA